MHGASRFLTLDSNLLVGSGSRRIASATRAALSPIHVQRMRNFLRPPRMHEAFSARGAVAKALAGDAAPLRGLMLKLAARIGRERWTTALPDATGIAENPNIPAGYTYLLQLIAHDMVHSSVSLAGTAAGGTGVANTRLAPLSLEFDPAGRVSGLAAATALAIAGTPYTVYPTGYVQ
mgnify:CR=1 FL=1